MMPFPVPYPLRGSTGGTGYLPVMPVPPVAAGFIPGLAVPGLAWPAGPGGT